LGGKAVKLSDYFFTYSWGDLKPIEELRDAWVKAYLAFGVLGLFVVRADSFVMAFVAPAAFGCYPAYLIGVWWQAKQRPEALSENALMVKQLRFLSSIFSAVGCLMLADFYFNA
jgi:hypothetical protein